MELAILVITAGILGYVLAGSLRDRKSRAGQVVKDARTENLTILFEKKKKPAPIAEGKIAAAEKQPSRRKAALRDSGPG